jgi:hypothetical protein
MELNKKESMEGEPLSFQWEIDESIKHPKSKRWYIIASIVTSLLIIYAIWESNYFFALILLLSFGLVVFYDNEPPRKVLFKIQYDGVEVGKRFYEFETISNFFIIYKPKEGVKRLYFQFKNPIKGRLSIPLNDEDPVEIRNYLLLYLDEDLDKENEPLSEGISKILKL